MNEDSSSARGYIAILIAGGIVALAAGLFFTTPAPGSVAILTGLLSALTLALGAVVQFYFGSSSGAKTLVASQNETVKTLAAAVATSAPVANALGDQPKGTPDDPVTVTEAKAEDPELTKFRKMARLANANATDEQINAAWAALKGVDIPT